MGKIDDLKSDKDTLESLSERSIRRHNRKLGRKDVEICLQVGMAIEQIEAIVCCPLNQNPDYLEAAKDRLSEEWMRREAKGKHV